MSSIKKEYPKVSFIMPVLNAAPMLKQSLPLIASQEYPKDKIEIIIADGHSTDDSVEIAKKYGAIVVDNPLKTSESGKAVALKNSSGELICLVDSDNLIIEKDWLKKMVKPLMENSDYLGSECLYFSFRPEDGYIDRYCALIGMNDPLCNWLGSYDRMNLISNTWTGLDVEFYDKADFLEVNLQGHAIPTIGANGCIFRKRIFDENPELVTDYLFDMDILQSVVNKHGPQKFAKVKVGIVHLYCGSSLEKFVRKQRRRVKDFLYRRSVTDVIKNENTEVRSYTYGYSDGKKLFFNIAKFGLSCVLVFPLIYQAFRGYIRKHDSAWLAHPLLCWATLIVYSVGTVESILNPGELSREGWK